ncbi:MAG: resuscitation-promoting factor [Thermomicrobiales bacterium]|jgi:hypothetical protein|nr:resuscitation-promoting factor [Thermomicrobiales bacterium]MDF3014791.1 resuscitation-promoting factor [Thermomicrobiales bacterium]
MNTRLFAIAALPVALLTDCAGQCQPQRSQTWTVDWNAIAECESGGNWSHRPVTNSHGTFSGGLMWNHYYWDRLGGERYADQPWQATKAEQIAVSEDYVDGSLAKVDQGWQCY